MNKDLLIEKWLNGSLTDKEWEMLQEMEDFSLYSDIVDDAKHFKASNFSTVDDFQTLKPQLSSKKKSIAKNSRPNRFMTPFMRVAAVLVVALGLYFAVFNTNETEVNAVASEQIMMSLPDASTITLNAMSEVVYDKDNWREKRALTLDGEAYFKVEKGNTFDVITSQGKVSVVGTQFSVKQRTDYFEVKCFEGKVKVTSQEKTSVLEAGKTFRIVDGEFSEGTTTLTKPEWTDAMSSFENVPYNHVLRELERQYDITIEMKDVRENPKFTGGFVHKNLEDALISITEPLNLTYDIKTSKQVLIYGSEK